MSDRPSWMPSDEEITRWLCSCPRQIDVWEGGHFSFAHDWVRRFTEVVGLKAQIEEAEYQHKQSLGGGFATEERVLELRARLAELDGPAVVDPGNVVATVERSWDHGANGPVHVVRPTKEEE